MSKKTDWEKIFQTCRRLLVAIGDYQTVVNFIQKNAPWRYKSDLAETLGRVNWETRYVLKSIADVYTDSDFKAVKAPLLAILDQANNFGWMWEGLIFSDEGESELADAKEKITQVIDEAREAIEMIQLAATHFHFKVSVKEQTRINAARAERSRQLKELGKSVALIIESMVKAGQTNDISLKKIQSKLKDKEHISRIAETPAWMKFKAICSTPKIIHTDDIDTIPSAGERRRAKDFDDIKNSSLD